MVAPIPPNPMLKPIVSPDAIPKLPGIISCDKITVVAKEEIRVKPVKATRMTVSMPVVYWKRNMSGMEASMEKRMTILRPK